MNNLQEPTTRLLRKRAVVQNTQDPEECIKKKKLHTDDGSESTSSDTSSLGKLTKETRYTYAAAMKQKLSKIQAETPKFDKVWDWKIVDIKDTRGPSCKEKLLDVYAVKDEAGINGKQDTGVSNVHIELKKELMFCEQLGWNWHKGWNLPDLSVTINNLEEPFLENCTYSAQVKCFTKPSNANELTKGVEILLRGQDTKEIVNGTCLFSALKFSTTSYKQLGHKFLLSVSVSRVVKEKKKDDLKNIISFISPAIFVDSRKSTRDTNDIKKSRFVYKNLDPFPPDLLTKPFAKTKKANHSALAVTMGNDFKGLRDYLSASNIKNKVKHPLFILLKFSTCMNLFYNTKFQDELKEFQDIERSIIWRLQSLLFSSPTSLPTTKKDTESDTDKIKEDSMFIIHVLSPKESVSANSMKFVVEHLDIHPNCRIQYIFQEEDLPLSYREVNKEQLTRVYKSIYPLLFRLKSRTSEGPMPLMQQISSQSTQQSNTDMPNIKEEDGAMQIEPFQVKLENPTPTATSLLMGMKPNMLPVEPLLALSRQQQASFLNSLARPIRQFQQAQQANMNMKYFLASQMNKNQEALKYSELLKGHLALSAEQRQNPPNFTPMQNLLTNQLLQQNLLNKAMLNFNCLPKLSFPFNSNI